MNDALILDGLLLVFMLLFALIGFWRGIVKEGLAAGGILFGALLADNWSLRLGATGSNVLNITANSSRFLAIEALLLFFALVVGYGSGSLIVLPVRGLGARFGGAIAGGVNGAMLLAFSLQAVREFVNRPTTQQLLDDSLISRALVDRFNWFLLGVAGAVLVLLFGRLVTEREAKRSPSAASSIEFGRRAARLPPPAESRKLEPPNGLREAAAPDGFIPAPRASSVEISEDRASSVDAHDEREWQTIRFSRDAARPIEIMAEPRCSNCGEALTRADIFCPLCGRPAAAKDGGSRDGLN